VKTFLAKLRDVATAGFFFLLPVYVLFIILTKAWSSLSSLGGSIAGMFGMKSILGVGGNTVFSGLLLITIWIACGLLVRVSFVAGFSKRVESLLSKYIPGYATYRTMAEEKLRNKVRMLPYRSALIKQQEYWRPAYVVEQDADGNCVVFLPETPDTSSGQILIAKREQVRIVPSVLRINWTQR
jgi:uncharacterized membrane protein